MGSALLACAGCGPRWYFEFESAEGQARGLERTMLVFYKDPLDLESSQMQDLLESAELAPLLRDKVLCMLVDEFPPNRRYVAQYGIRQPPGLVLIHPDGTYHAHNGPMTLEQITDFLARAKPPGAKPTLNPQIPRSIDYHWEGIYEDAVEKARRQNRELFIVYKWWLSPESTELLAVLQTRPEVARHFTETVNCLLDQDYAPNRAHVRKYGVTRVPSVILVHRDGTYHAHTGPMTADQIVRFVTSAKAPGKIQRGGKSFGWCGDSGEIFCPQPEIQRYLAEGVALNVGKPQPIGQKALGDIARIQNPGVFVHKDLLPCVMIHPPQDIERALGTGRPSYVQSLRRLYNFNILRSCRRCPLKDINSPRKFG